MAARPALVEWNRLGHVLNQTRVRLKMLPLRCGGGCGHGQNNGSRGAASDGTSASNAAGVLDFAKLHRRAADAVHLWARAAFAQ